MEFENLNGQAAAGLYIGEARHESRLDAEHVENTKVVSEYQEVIDQPLDDQMSNVPPECELKNPSTMQYQSFGGWSHISIGTSKLADEARPEVLAQETPAQEVLAPAQTSPEVFNVTVPESVMADPPSHSPDQIIKFPRLDSRERQAKDPEGIEL